MFEEFTRFVFASHWLIFFEFLSRIKFRVWRWVAGHLVFRLSPSNVALFGVTSNWARWPTGKPLVNCVTCWMQGRIFQCESDKFHNISFWLMQAPPLMLGAVYWELFCSLNLIGMVYLQFWTLDHPRTEPMINEYSFYAMRLVNAYSFISLD